MLTQTLPMDIPSRPLDASRFNTLAHLSSGSYGEVFTAADLENNNKEVVIKKIPKTNSNRRVKNEIEAHEKIPQSKKGLVKFHGSFESRNHLYLVFDRVRGGDLFALMEHNGFRPLPEFMVLRILRSVVNTLVHCHNHGVAHRDIKLENILVDPHVTSAVLIDFGLCSFFTSSGANESLTEDLCGSLEYIAPEVIFQKPLQASKTDSWALGITMYCLLFGQFPYAVTDALQRGEDPYGQETAPSVPLPKNSMEDGIQVSEELRGLLSGLLRFDPQSRTTVQAASQHPLLKKNKKKEFCHTENSMMI
ncbi:CAMK family protein kinase [Planoprotostelium fungivorum]|uniref:CAMK family protein kinase n=1 Tax=Planoprotostelium fungivorum TaxID=1890364 RepID=A0A2P6N621_9EUKA|nr:CAMK family protein kinase [Planoprotostelium fungivorum]